MPRTSASEEGFTLLELVVTMTLLTLVLGSLLGVFQVVQRQAAFVEDRSDVLDSMRNALDRMTKEVRQAKIVEPGSTTDRLEMTTYVLGVEKRIVYEVDGESLTRSVAGGTPVVLQDAVAIPGVFAYTSDAGGVVQVVAMTLSVHPARHPDTTLVLTSEVRVRNGTQF